MGPTLPCPVVSPGPVGTTVGPPGGRAGIVGSMIDVTDATFEQEVLRRSSEVPVVVDLWAPWCGPCVTLGPMLERAVDATDGAVVLAKVNVDENPAVASSFQVQSIPAVFAVRDGAVVDGFVGAVGEAAVAEFVERLVPVPSEADRLVTEAATAGSGAGELLRRALDLQPDHVGAIVGLATLLVGEGTPEAASEATGILARIPETPETRRLLAEARLVVTDVEVTDDGIDELLTGLLDRVRDDDDARQEFVDLLERLGPDDPRTPGYRRALASRIF